MPATQLRDRVQRLKTERDRLRLQVRLGSMQSREAFKRWSKRLAVLEKHLEAAGKVRTDELAHALERISQSFEKLRNRIEEPKRTRGAP